MKDYFDILMSVGLFADIDNAELENMLKCLNAEIKTFKKGEIVLLAGNTPRHIGIVLSGQLHIVKEDLDGNSSLMAAVTSGEIFAEALCCAAVEESPVTVLSGESSTVVMLLQFDRILHTCPKLCDFHQKLIENMLKLVARKNLFLQSRMEIISIKSVREKVLRYLESFVSKQGNNITIPFNREEMAEYLCVERSALSHELIKMKKDGILDYKKNKFFLK